MAPKNKILFHPDKEEIVKWLTEGISVREVEKRLANRYCKKNQHHKRVSVSTIQSFKTTHLNLKGKVLEDIKEHTRLAQRLVQIHSKQDKVEKLTAYQEAIQKAAENELNTTEQLLKVFTLIEIRLQGLFNMASESEFFNRDLEKSLQGYIDQMMKAFEQHKKYIEGHKETTETSININIMTDQVSVMRDAIRDTLQEVEPELAIIFMDKLNGKMRDLVYKEPLDINSKFLNQALGARYDS